MPDPNIRTWAAGNRLDAADVNSYLMKQAVIKTTNVGVAAPASPQAGMTVYETTQASWGHGLVCYTTVTTGWQRPWNLPWGVMVSQVCSITDQTGIAAQIDVTGLTGLTFTAVANRRYRISFGGVAYFATTNGVAGFYGMDASNNVLGGCYYENGGTALNINMAVSMASRPITGIASGSVTWKVRAQAVSGAGLVIRNSSSPMWACVEDIGPNAAPA